MNDLSLTAASYPVQLDDGSTLAEKMTTWRFCQASIPGQQDTNLAFCLVFQAFGDVAVSCNDQVKEIISDGLRVYNDKSAMLTQIRRAFKNRNDIEMFLIKHRLLEKKGRVAEALLTSFVDKSTEITSWCVRKAEAGVHQLPTRFLYVTMKVDEDALADSFDEVNKTPKQFMISEVRDMRDEDFREVQALVIKD